MFQQAVEVVRYLLFMDRKKYPIKRGGMEVPWVTFSKLNVECQTLVLVLHKGPEKCINLKELRHKYIF